MDDKTALHTAARRYCQERFSEWTRIYEDLQRKENWQVQKPFQSGWDYSAEAYGTFPRYRFAKNTQVEVERLIPASSADFSDMRDRIIAAAQKSRAKLDMELTNNLACRALIEEEEDFAVYMQTLAPTDLKEIEQLP